jgi:Zn finger protein HypA/HybF involved in hydrogenase expression
MPENKPLYVECLNCGERWKLLTLPMNFNAAARRLKGAFCPNCDANANQIKLCMTDGESIVVQSRKGTPKE